MPDIEKLKQEAEDARDDAASRMTNLVSFVRAQDIADALIRATALHLRVQAAEKEAEAKKSISERDAKEYEYQMRQEKRHYEERVRANPELYKPTPIADDGWIKWDGGSRPMPNYAIVEVKLRDGDIRKGCVENFRWHYLGSEFAYGDIIAYRIISPAADRIEE